MIGAQPSIGRRGGEGRGEKEEKERGGGEESEKKKRVPLYVSSQPEGQPVGWLTG
jgi:hypothetical protein